MAIRASSSERLPPVFSNRRPVPAEKPGDRWHSPSSSKPRTARPPIRHPGQCVLVGPAAAAAPAGGPIELWASAGNNGSQHIVFVGAIGDYGTAVNVNKNGKPNPNGNYVKVRLKKGTFMIDTTAVNKAINSEQDPQVGSHATCSAAFTGSAPVTFGKGTGLYKGISGTANATLTFGGVGSRYPSGPKKGQCKQGGQSPRSSFGFVTGQGTVSFAPKKRLDRCAYWRGG